MFRSYLLRELLYIFFVDITKIVMSGINNLYFVLIVAVPDIWEVGTHLLICTTPILLEYQPSQHLWKRFVS